MKPITRMPIDATGAVQIGGPQPTILTPTDLLTEGTLKDVGPTIFFAGKDAGPDSWGKFSKDRDVVGVTILAHGAGRAMVPLALARVVLRLKPDMVMFDQRTRGDGTTFPIPFQAVPTPTPLGMYLHAPLRAGAEWRLEVDDHGFASARVKVILHTVQADPVAR